MALVRGGECSQCGDCCKDSESPTGYCSYARIEPDGKVACSDRTPANPYYWNNCRVWPDAPNTIEGLKRCTYWFKVV